MHTIVVDLGYGDAGKGTVVDRLCASGPVRAVVRFNGGAQAAHNVVTTDGRHHTFAQFGSGTLQGVATHLSRFMLVDPLALAAEADHLAALGVRAPYALLSVDRAARLTTPYHAAANRLREQAAARPATVRAAWASARPPPTPSPTRRTPPRRGTALHALVCCASCACCASAWPTSSAAGCPPRRPRTAPTPSPPSPAPSPSPATATSPASCARARSSSRAPRACSWTSGTVSTPTPPGPRPRSRAPRPCWRKPVRRPAGSASYGRTPRATAPDRTSPRTPNSPRCCPNRTTATAPGRAPSAPATSTPSPTATPSRPAAAWTPSPSPTSTRPAAARSCGWSARTTPGRRGCPPPRPGTSAAGPPSPNGC